MSFGEWIDRWGESPVTFGGLAALSRAPDRRLALFRSATAALVAAVVVWFIGRSWWPALEKAVNNLGEGSVLADGRLTWSGSDPVLLTDYPFLSVAVNLSRTQELDQSADLQLELGERELRVRSVLGYVAATYPEPWALRLDRSEILPWWGAWRPVMLAVAGGLTFVSLVLSWIVLSSIYVFPLRIWSFLWDRDAGLRECWRLAFGAQLPGALWVAVALFCYGFHRLNLPGFLACWVIHWLITWVYLLVVPLKWPRSRSAPQRVANPFKTG